MKGLGIILAGISGIAMLIGMQLVEYHNSQGLRQFIIDQTPYTPINETLMTLIIYGGGGVILIFGLFCIALDVALDRKTTRV